MGQSPAKATANKKWAFSERKARESRNLYLLLGFGSAAAAFAAAATALGAAAANFRPFLGPELYRKPPNKEAGNPTENTPLSASSPSSPP
jgi:hypothetical protein